MTKIRKKSSKRNTLRKQYSVAKKVREHKKKLKKEIRTMKKSGVQKPIAKVLGIPNSFPDKAKMLDEMEYNEKLQTEAKKHAIALKKAQKAMPQGTMESYAEPIKGQVIQMDQSNQGKLSLEDIKQAERLMEISGEIETNAR
jgi:GNL3L/Grn1 putative GTPase